MLTVFPVNFSPSLVPSPASTDCDAATNDILLLCTLLLDCPLQDVNHAYVLSFQLSHTVFGLDTHTLD